MWIKSGEGWRRVKYCVVMVASDVVSAEQREGEQEITKHGVGESKSKKYETERSYKEAAATN